VLIPIALGWFLLLAALREFSPDGDAFDSLRVVVISFVVAVVATGLFAAALKVSARNRAAANDNRAPDNRANDNTGATV
jgi:NADH-quinone oxidoreductase subunit H